MADITAFLKIDVDEDTPVEQVNYLVTRCQELEREFRRQDIPFGWSVRSAWGAHDRSPDYPDDRPELRG